MCDHPAPPTTTTNEIVAPKRSMALPPQSTSVFCRTAAIASQQPWDRTSLLRRRPVAVAAASRRDTVVGADVLPVLVQLSKRSAPPSSSSPSSSLSSYPPVRGGISDNENNSNNTMVRRYAAVLNRNSRCCGPPAPSFYFVMPRPAAGGGGAAADICRCRAARGAKALYFSSTSCSKKYSSRKPPPLPRLVSNKPASSEDDDTDDRSSPIRGTSSSSSSSSSSSMQYQEVRTYLAPPFAMDWLARAWTPPSRNADHPAVVAAAASLALNIDQWKPSSATLEALPPLDENDRLLRDTAADAATSNTSTGAMAPETAPETTTMAMSTSSGSDCPTAEPSSVVKHLTRAGREEANVEDGEKDVDGRGDRQRNKAVVQQQPPLPSEGGMIVLERSSTAGRTGDQEKTMMEKKGLNNYKPQKMQPGGNYVWEEIYDGQEELYGEPKVQDDTHAGEARLQAEPAVVTDTSTESSSLSLEDGPSKRVYVGGLPRQVGWQALKEHMESTGLIAKWADVARHQDGRSKGFGTVEFHSVDDVQKAIEQLNNTDVRGRIIFVRVYREDLAAAEKESKGRRGSKQEEQEASQPTESDATRARPGTYDGAATPLNSTHNNISFASSDGNNNIINEVGIQYEKAELAENRHENKSTLESSSSANKPPAIANSYPADRSTVATAPSSRLEDNDDNDDNNVKTITTTVDNNDTSTVDVPKGIPWWASRRNLHAQQDKAV